MDGPRIAEPGWYADPGDPGSGRLRWYDGMRWTDQVSAAGVVQASPYDVTPPAADVDTAVDVRTLSVRDAAVVVGWGLVGLVGLVSFGLPRDGSAVVTMIGRIGPYWLAFVVATVGAAVWTNGRVTPHGRGGSVWPRWFWAIPVMIVGAVVGILVDVVFIALTGVVEIPPPGSAAKIPVPWLALFLLGALVVPVVWIVTEGVLRRRFYTTHRFLALVVLAGWVALFQAAAFLALLVAEGG